MSKYKVPTTKELFDAGVHFGHLTRKWHPAMEKYIYSVKNNSHIIDLGRTDENLKKACAFLYQVASRGEQIIVVGTKKQGKDITVAESKRSGALYVDERWLGGTITNLETIKRSIDKLVDLLRKREEKTLDKYTKKERLLIDREIERLERSFGGLVGIKGVPGALFVVDARREKTAIQEANKYNVPVVALVDTNTNPANVDYVIPGNDDGIKSLTIIVKTIADAIQAGYEEYANKLKDGKPITKVEKKGVVKEALVEKAPVKAAENVHVNVSMDESRISTEGAKEEALDVDLEEVAADMHADEKASGDVVATAPTEESTEEDTNESVEKSAEDSKSSPQTPSKPSAKKSQGKAKTAGATKSKKESKKETKPKSTK